MPKTIKKHKELDILTKQRFTILLPLLLITIVGCQGGSGLNSSPDSNSVNSSIGEPTPIVLPSNPNYGPNVTAHDPSVFKDVDGAYYTFGSHFAVTKSTNLFQWEQISRDGGANNLYARDWRVVLADAFAHVGSGPGSTWAPAVHRFGEKYYMYYSLSTFGSSVSYIGRVEADSVLGLYDNSVEIVKSDGRGGPNAIDPELFFDTEGRLWMVYGSFFAGIYIKEMHASGPDVGKPLETGYGKLVWQGGNQGPEGPFVFYNPDTEYYYLMASHGSLSSNYNMRVARSANPDGPYVDPRGFDVSNFRDSGLKLAGNYQFSGYARGYAALGHNSVLIEDGKYLVVYHTRYRQGATGVTGNHNQFVNQLFFNKNDWPVLAPNRFAGESVQHINMEQASKSYDVLIHTGGDSEGFATSVEYQFTTNGNIVDFEQDVIGTWDIEGDHYVAIRIGLNTYEASSFPNGTTTFNARDSQSALTVAMV